MLAAPARAGFGDSASSLFGAAASTSAGRRDHGKPPEWGWGALPPPILARCLHTLCGLVHAEQPGGMLSLRQATRLMMTCSPNRRWQAVAMVEMRCQLRLKSAGEVRRLAAVPLPCSRLDLPPLLEESAAYEYIDAPEAELLAAMAAQAATELRSAALALLSSPAFRLLNAGRLLALHHCPFRVAAMPEVVDNHFPVLQLLAVHSTRRFSELFSPASRRLLPRLPSLRELEVALPDIAAGHLLEWPPHLRLCRLRTYGSALDSQEMHITPCGCRACAAGFWGTVRALHLAAPNCNLALVLQDTSALRSCVELKLQCGEQATVCYPGCGALATTLCSHAPGRYVPLPAVLQHCIATLLPLFAATPLQLFELEAHEAYVGCDLLRPEGMETGLASFSRLGLRAEVTNPSPATAGRFLLRVTRHNGA